MLATRAPADASQDTELVLDSEGSTELEESEGACTGDNGHQETFVSKRAAFPVGKACS